MSDLEYSIFQSFRKMITLEKIRNFQNECILYQKEHHLKENNNKIPKNIFIFLFQKIFSSDSLYNTIYELFFKRFKNNKCIFKTEKNKENYILCDITSTEDIDIYNVEIALIVFHKCDFFTKMKIIFEITDYDDDGLISENEIKKIIFTINNLFPRDVNQLNSNSHLISQSLSNIFANNIYRSIMFFPGNLAPIIHKEKYVNFKTLMKAIIKIKNYKYNIIPLYVNIKNCLLEEKKEIEFDMNNNIINDFISISYELINQNILNYNEGDQKVKIKNVLDPKMIVKKKKKDPIIEYKEKKAKEAKEREIRSQKHQSPKKYDFKKSVSMYNYNMENIIRNKLSKLNKKNNNNSSSLLSTAYKSILNINNKQKNSLNNIKNFNTRKKRLYSIRNTKNPSFFLNSINKTSERSNSEDKKRNKLNLNIFSKKDNSEILSSSSSNLLDNENLEITTKEKLNNNNYNKLIIEKANYDKLINIQFPPCKIVSLKTNSYFPKFHKKNKSTLSCNGINSCLLKTRYEIRDDINKVIKQNYNFEGEVDNMNEILKKINFQKKILGKYIINGDNISPYFFKFNYNKMELSRNYSK